MVRVISAISNLISAIKRSVAPDQFLHRRVQQQLLVARVRDLPLPRHKELASQRAFFRQRTEASGSSLAVLTITEPSFWSIPPCVALYF